MTDLQVITDGGDQLVLKINPKKRHDIVTNDHIPIKIQGAMIAVIQYPGNHKPIISGLRKVSFVSGVKISAFYDLGYIDTTNGEMIVPTEHLVVLRYMPLWRITISYFSAGFLLSRID